MTKENYGKPVDNLQQANHPQVDRRIRRKSIGLNDACSSCPSCHELSPSFIGDGHTFNKIES